MSGQPATRSPTRLNRNAGGPGTNRKNATPIHTSAAFTKASYTDCEPFEFADPAYIPTLRRTVAVSNETGIRLGNLNLRFELPGPGKNRQRPETILELDFITVAVA